MCESYKIALYTVLPVNVRHVKNARTWLPTTLYIVLWGEWHSQSYYIGQPFTSAAAKSVFRLIKVHFIDLGEKPEGDIMMPSLASEAQVI